MACRSILASRLANERSSLSQGIADAILRPTIGTPTDPNIFWNESMKEIVVPDVAVVPMNAFDDRGYRLGYGGGFFDRTLATPPNLATAQFSDAERR